MYFFDKEQYCSKVWNQYYVFFDENLTNKGGLKVIIANM